MKIEYFFFNVDFGQKLTGIERSSFKRAILFAEYLNIIPHFVTANLNLNLRKNWQHYQNIGWIPEKSHLLNVYEDIRKKTKNNVKKNELSFDGFEVKYISDTHRRFYKNDKKFNMYVVWRDESRKILDYINYFYDGIKIRRDKFDLDGILAVTQYLNKAGKVDYEDIFDQEGARCLTQIYDEKSKINKIYLYNQNGIIYDVFFNQNETFSFE